MKSGRMLLTVLLFLILLCSCKDALPGTDLLPKESPVPRGFAPELLPVEENADKWSLADFPACFDGEERTSREDVPLSEGLTVTVLRGVEDGPLVYIVAGIHGDEVAGWRAGELLKGSHLRAGTLCIVSPANTYGAAHVQRRTKAGNDLNRSFPGSADGSDAERIAAALWEDISQREPVLLLDLHEAHEASGGTDALGNSLICASLDGIDTLVWEMLLASENGTLCAAPLTLYGSPPDGSINRATTELLAISAITVETLRTEPLAQRVRNQLEIVEYVLQYENLL